VIFLAWGRANERTAWVNISRRKGRKTILKTRANESDLKWAPELVKQPAPYHHNWTTTVFFLSRFAVVANSFTKSKCMITFTVIANWKQTLQIWQAHQSLGLVDSKNWRIQICSGSCKSARKHQVYICDRYKFALYAVKEGLGCCRWINPRPHHLQEPLQYSCDRVDGHNEARSQFVFAIPHAYGRYIKKAAPVPNRWFDAWLTSLTTDREQAISIPSPRYGKCKGRSKF
jgi:hypothetical protein